MSPAGLVHHQGVLTGPEPALSTWDDARLVAHRAADPLPTRPVALASALGGVLTEPLRALVAVPELDCSAMDGYAVCGPPPWTVVAGALAGAAPPAALRPGTACEIATGVPVPHGTVAVLPYEHADRAGDLVSGAVPAGRHIRRAGEQCTAGEQVLPEGAVLGPAALGLAAALGWDTVQVRPLPTVLALVTGDELLDSGVPSGGRVRDAIGPLLPGFVSWAGGTFVGVQRLPDSPSLLGAALRGAEANVLLVSGSSSRGPADHLRPVLTELDAELLVDGVQCRPGHPQALARLPDGRLVIGLPGNPLAAVVAFLTLALPALTGLRGRPLPELSPAPAATELVAGRAGTRLVPVRLRGGTVTELPHAGSAMLRGLALADALAVVGQAGPVRLHPLPATDRY